MASMIISFFVAVLSFNFFIISFQINGVNRLVLGVPISLYETAIVLFDIDEEEPLYFDKEILEDNLTSYFDYSIPRYTNDYALSFYYYNPENMAICLDEKCRAVEVKVQANLALSYHYQKTMYYEIRRT